MIKFSVMGEPRGKQRPKAQNMGKYIHIYTPQATINYENYIKLSYLDALERSKGTLEPLSQYLNKETMLEAKISIFQSIPKSTSKKKALLMLEGNIRPIKKPDIDNILKSVFDGLNGIAFKDDTQIIRIQTEKFYSNEPRIDIEIKEI